MIPDSLILLAGFVLAHSAWSVSDLPKGEFLVPLAIVEKTSQRQLLRFEAQTQEQAIAEGKAALAQRQGQLDAWAFGREGLLSGGTGKVDVLTVDAWAKGMTRPITFVQQFTPYSSGVFRVRGDAMAIVDGKELEGAEAARLVKKLYEGALQSYLHCGVPLGHVFAGKLEVLLAVDGDGSWRAVSPHWRSRRQYSFDGYLLLEGRAKEGYVLFPKQRHE